VAKGTKVSGPKTDTISSAPTYEIKHKLGQNNKEIQVEDIAIFLIILEAQMNILFSIKLKILFLFNDHMGSPSSCLLNL
jgi:hypothetical protein